MFGLRQRRPIPHDPRGTSAPRDPFDTLPVEERFLAVVEQIRDLARDCDYHSDVLSWLAARRRNLRRDLNFTAGLITLISGGAVWAIITDALTSTSLRYASALCTLAGGLCTLVTTHFLDDDQTERLVRGAGKFRSLGLDAATDLNNPAFIELSEFAAARRTRRRSTAASSEHQELEEEQGRQFREAADLAYAKLAELTKRRHETVEFEPFVKDAQTERRRARHDPWAG